MEPSLRHRLGPIAGIVTLTIGITLVTALQMFVSLFSESAVATAKPEPMNVLLARPEDKVPNNKLELSCYDPQILTVWHDLKKDKLFKSRVVGETGIFDCASILEVKQVDLNNDGRLEVLARGKDSLLCGNGRAGCGLWIFSDEQDRRRLLLSGADHADTNDVADVLKKSRTRSYSDVLLKTFFGPGDEMKYSTYVYNGRDYVRTRCMREIAKNSRDEDRGVFELIPCDN